MYVLRVCLVLLVACVVLTAAGRYGQKGTGPLIWSPNHICPFGGSLDIEMTQNDDGNSGPITIPRFTFFGKGYTRLYVNTNGLISFNRPKTDYTPEWFLQTSDVLIAPYWTDVSTLLNGGRVYYRATTMTCCINKLTELVQAAFSNKFQAKWLLFTTWHRVTFYGSGSRPPLNTFQAVLVTDGRESYVVFNYGDIAWTTGTSSDGDADGLGGTPAEMGFNAGDGTRYYTQFTSLTPDVIDIRTKTNCNQRGRFVFRVDGREILSPPPSRYGRLTPTGVAVSKGKDKGKGKGKGKKKPEAPVAAPGPK